MGLVSQVRGGASSSKPVPLGSALPAFGAGCGHFFCGSLASVSSDGWIGPAFPGPPAKGSADSAWPYGFFMQGSLEPVGPFHQLELANDQFIHLRMNV